MMKAQKLNFDMCLYSAFELSAGIKFLHMSAFFIVVFHCIEKNYIDNHKYISKKKKALRSFKLVNMIFNMIYYNLFNRLSFKSTGKDERRS